MLFRKKSTQHQDYDKENLEPAILCSICTGEQTAGFRNIHNGKFTGVMLIRTDKELETFKKTYGLTGEIKKIY
jgi:hypothetical protein